MLAKSSHSHARLVLCDPFADEDKWLAACEFLRGPMPIVSYADPLQPLAVKVAVALLWAELMVIGQYFISALLTNLEAGLLLAVLILLVLYPVAILICQISSGIQSARNTYSAFLLLNILFLKLPYLVGLLRIGDCSFGLFLFSEIIVPIGTLCLLYTNKSNFWYQMKEDQRESSKSDAMFENAAQHPSTPASNFTARI